MTVKVGDKAPDFTLPSQMGDNVTLSEFLGKKNIYTFTLKTSRQAAHAKPALSGTAMKFSQI